MIYRLTIAVRVDAADETAALRECAKRLLKMTETIPDGERRRLFMPGDGVTVRPEAGSLILPS